MFDDQPHENNLNPQVAAPSLGAVPPAPSADNVRKNAVEDMFAETEKKEKPPVFQKKPEINPAPAENEEYTPRNHQKIFFLIFLLLLLVLLAVGGVWGYRYMMQNYLSETADNLMQASEAVDTESDESPVPAENIAPDQTEALADTTETIADPDSIANTQESASAQSAASTSEASQTADSGQEIQSEQATDTETATLDSDNDGLTDEEEWRLGTMVNNVDSDNDGLFDREEVRVYKTDPLNPDTDGDGFTDGDEVKAGYNPLGEGRLFEAEKQNEE